MEESKLATPEITDPTRLWGPGDIIQDRYEVLSILPGGAMGQVYRMRHLDWNVELVIKSPKPHMITTEELKQRFIREAESWVELGLHPHITTCYYVAQIEGMPRIVLEYVEGGTLKESIAQGTYFQDWETPLGVAIQLCLGLEYAHNGGLSADPSRQKGMIHRDLKPANVLLTKEGTPKLTDFGLVKRIAQAAEAEEDGSLQGGGAGGTQVGTVLGTPAYMAPEQWMGAEQTSVHTDIYALGVVLYELFCGRLPFELPAEWRYAIQEAQILQWERLHKEEPVPDPSQWREEFPEPLAALLTQCLAKAPEDRPVGGAVVREQLEAIYEAKLGRKAPYAEAAARVDLRADSLNNRALSYMDLGKESEAESAWEAALAIDSQHLETAYNQGVLLWRRGKLTDDALVQQLEAIQTSHSGQWRAHYLLALVHLERGDVDSAISLLEEASVQAPGERELQDALSLARSDEIATARCLRTLEGGPTLMFNPICLSPDGRWALSGKMYTLQLWEVATGQRLRIFEGHSGEVHSACLSADGRLALSGSADKTARLWELDTGQCLRVFEGYKSPVTSVYLSTDGRVALLGSQDGALRLWEVATGQCLWGIEESLGWVYSVCLSTDGRVALTGSAKGMHLWDVATGQCLRFFREAGAYVNSVYLNADSRLALSGSSYGMRLWAVETGRCLQVFGNPQDRNGIAAVGLSADGRLALSKGGYGMRLWEVATGRCVRTFTKRHYKVAMSADGRLAVSGAMGERMQLWELPCESVRICSFQLSRPWSYSESSAVEAREEELLKKGQEALRKGRFGTALALVREARELPVSKYAPQSLDAWAKLLPFCSRVGLRSSWLVRTFEGHTHWVRSVCFNSDGHLALSVDYNSTLRLWEVATGKCLRILKHVADPVCLSTDGRLVLGKTGGYKLCLWEIATGQCLRTFEGHTEDVLTVCLSVDGRFALSGSRDKTARLWEVDTGRCLRTFEMDRSWVHSARLSADGRLAFVGGDGGIQLWNVATGCRLQTFEEPEGICSMSLSTDGRFVLGSDTSYARSKGNGGVWLWDVATGHCLRTFEGHRYMVASVCLSTDGHFALSGGKDKTVRLWEVATGRCLRSFEEHTEEVNSVCLSPDGRFVLAGSHDKTARLWELDWELEPYEPADWDEGARPYLETFLTLHTPYACVLPQDREPSREEIQQALTRRGKPTWNEQDFQALIRQLQYAGYGRLRPEGVRHELKRIAATWDGPLPLSGV